MITLAEARRLLGELAEEERRFSLIDSGESPAQQLRTLATVSSDPYWSSPQGLRVLGLIFQGQPGPVTQ
jgi:hypothetical protein